MASNDLKRVGLVFTQEGAVDFKKTLQDINLEMNKNYNQFKLTQAQWDKSTTSTQKLRAEQEYLKNAYEVQQDKVSTLRMQLSDLENAEEKNVTAIKKKRNELTSAEVKLESYNKRIKEIEGQLHNTGKKIEEFGEKTINVGNKIEGAGKKLSVFSAATTAALVASAKSAIDFEDAFTGVEKTVDGTDEQMASLRQGIRDLAKEIPSTTTEISAVAEAAGQLGIQTDNVLEFTKTMINMGNATNLSADEAATTLARFANVTKMSQSDFGRLGSVIVALGNNFATTESEIAAMGMNLGSAGKQVGMSQAQIMALATALSSVGLEAQAGGTAFSKVMVNMQLAVEKGGKNLKNFASVAGMTTKQFKKAFKEDATTAIMKFVEGLSKSGERGKSAIKVLDDMGITETRLRDALLRSANASDVMSKAIELGNKAWNENTALTNEANKRYDTLKSKLTIAMNKLKDIAITVGEKLMPAISKVVEKIGEWADGFSKLSDEQVQMIVNIGLVIAAIGPLLTILGKVLTVGGSTLKAVGTFTQAIGVARGTITSTSSAVNGLAKVFTAVTNPIGIACTAIGAAVAVITVEAIKAEEKTKQAFKTMGDSANEFISGIDTAKSHLDSFNTTLFISNEEQQNMRTQMEEVQQGITNICRTASEERRQLNESEIQKFDEYFTKLRELNQREVEIQMEISEAITQQAITNAESFEGSLEEYKVNSQEWIKTAEEQKSKTIELINRQTIEEVALLNQRYKTEEERQTEEYQKEYAKIMEQKQEKVDAVNQEVSEICSAYTEGYQKRGNILDEFDKRNKEANKKIEDENNRHNEWLNILEGQRLMGNLAAQQQIEEENERHSRNIQGIWNDIYSGMSEEQQKELGIWLANVAQTEMYGGQIDDKTRRMVDNVINSFDRMSPSAREAMQQTMQGMYNGMRDKEPSLFSKAMGIANGILSRLKKALDIHSPSRKTREIFRNVMKRNGEGN